VGVLLFRRPLETLDWLFLGCGSLSNAQRSSADPKRMEEEPPGDRASH
jgi:hypothetical protein